MKTDCPHVYQLQGHCEGYAFGQCAICDHLERVPLADWPRDEHGHLRPSYAPGR
jgi:hypothetical protein